MGGTPDVAALTSAMDGLSHSIALSETASSPEAAAAAQAAQESLIKAQQQLEQRNYGDAQVSLYDARNKAQRAGSLADALPR